MADRSPLTDPQPGDRLSLGGALVRVVVAVDGTRVSWTLEARGPDNGRQGITSLAHWRRTFAPKPAGGQEEFGDLDWDDAPLEDA